ncbi:MAG TPA: ubiquitin-like small modifier protein 1 [Thermoanaerobaculia bacterium]|jgi:molybdopterin converting factor small subunit
MSRATVRIPTPLRTFTGGAGEVPVEAATVGEVLRVLGESHAGLAERILDGEGRLRNFVNVFVNDRNVRVLEGLESAVPDGAVINIVPAVAGGKP